VLGTVNSVSFRDLGPGITLCLLKRIARPNVTVGGRAEKPAESEIPSSEMGNCRNLASYIELRPDLRQLPIAQLLLAAYNV
jgi:hypothetical protein